MSCSLLGLSGGQSYLSIFLYFGSDMLPSMVYYAKVKELRWYIFSSKSLMFFWYSLPVYPRNFSFFYFPDRFICFRLFAKFSAIHLRMEEGGNPPVAASGGFLDGNDTVYNYTDDDIRVETAIVRTAAGW